jgi:hypothetical protein
MIEANGVELCTEPFGDPTDPRVLLVIGTTGNRRRARSSSTLLQATRECAQSVQTALESKPRLHRHRRSFCPERRWYGCLARVA